MKLNIGDIINKHRGIPCVVALHGPSLNNNIKQIQDKQDDGYLRISVNEWYDYFTKKPDYWVVSNSEFTIKNSIVPNPLWDIIYKYPKNVFNKCGIPLFYNNTADLTSAKFVEDNLNIDYYPYDSRHFQGLKCSQILNEFRSHYEQNKNFNFTKFGNHNFMWKPKSVKGTKCDPVYAKFGNGWTKNDSCCHKINIEEKTIQEQLQLYTGHHQHLGPGVTVGTFAIIFAILMECNPIYVSGMDLDYEKGYANTHPNGQKHQINRSAIGHWKHVLKDEINNDLTILRDSAALAGIDIINLNKDSWHKIFKIENL